MKQRSKQDWSAMVQRVAGAQTEDFAQLVNSAGLDTQTELRFGDFAGVSFRGADLRGFDFSGAKLCECDFSGAQIEGARFDAAEIAAVNLRNADRLHAVNREASSVQGQLFMPDFDPSSYADFRIGTDNAEFRVSTDAADSFAKQEEGPPATHIRVTNLQEAIDWKAHIKSWRPQAPENQPTDDHLRPGAVFQDAPFAPQMLVVPKATFHMTMTFEKTALAKSPSLTKKLIEVLGRRKTIPRAFAVGRFSEGVGADDLGGGELVPWPAGPARSGPPRSRCCGNAWSRAGGTAKRWQAWSYPCRLPLPPSWNGPGFQCDLHGLDSAALIVTQREAEVERHRLESRCGGVLGRFQAARRDLQV
jgi:Pentapeptide repeats (8 copies)